MLLNQIWTRSKMLNKKKTCTHNLDKEYNINTTRNFTKMSNVSHEDSFKLIEEENFKLNK